MHMMLSCTLNTTVLCDSIITKYSEVLRNGSYYLLIHFISKFYIKKEFEYKFLVGVQHHTLS